MNSVMTAGLHHRWRARAADLAAVGARRPRRSTSRPAPATWRSSWPRASARTARSSARTSPRRCSSARARKAPAIAFEWGNALELPYADGALRRRDGRLRRAQLLRPRPRAAPRWRASCGPAAASSCSRSRRRTRPPLSTFFRVWFDRVVPLIGRVAGEPRRLQLPAELGAGASPAPRGAGRGDGRAPGCATSAGSSPPAASSRSTSGRGPDGGRAAAVAEVVRAGRRRTSRRCSPRVEERLARARRRARRGARRARRRDDRRRRQAAAPAARAPRRRATRDGERRSCAPRAAVELVHSATLVHDDVLDAAVAAPRRARRSWPPAGRGAATATGDLLFARAFAELVAQRARRRGPRAVAARARALAEGELLQREDAWDAERRRRALPAPLRAEDRAAVRGRVPARRAGGRRRRRPRSATSAGASGSPSSCSTTCSTSPGPAERTGKHRGTDLLDGTVTLPFILARERDPELAALDPRAITTPQAAEEVCDRIEATGALDEARGRALAIVAEAKDALPAGLRRAASARALELVADGVVERYA